MYIARIPSKFDLLLLKPLGWPTTLATTAAALLLLYSYSVPGGYVRLHDRLAPLWLVVAAIWCFRATTRLILGLRFRVKPTLRTAVRTCLSPAILILTLLLIRTDVPVRLGFLASRPAMNQLAMQVIRAPQTQFAPRRVGIYSASNIRFVNGGMVFLVNDAGWNGSYGFAYLPNGIPTDWTAARYRPFSGNWYLYEHPW